MPLRLMDRPRAGPMPNYSDAEIYWAMYLMSEGHSMSRAALSKSLGIGEGTTKNILRTLREANLTITFRTGTQLNSIGMDLFRTIPMKPVDIEIPQLTSRFHQSVIVNGASPESIRDVKDADAEDCFIFSSDLSQLLPLVVNDDHRFDGVGIITGDYDHLRDGDYIVVGCGNSLHEARSRAISISLNLI